MAENTQGITKITVAGYKSIRDEMSIDVRPLTILAGANSSGKSSIMQPILLMKQTLDASHDPGPLLLDGPHVRFTQYEQFIPMGTTKKKPVVSVGLKIGEEVYLSCEYECTPDADSQRRQIRLKSMSGRDPIAAKYDERPAEFRLTPNMREKQIIPFLPGFMREDQNKDPDGDEDNNVISKRRLGFRVESKRCFLQLQMFRKYQRKNRPFPSLSIPIEPTPEMQSAIANLIHLPGLRGQPERIYTITPSQAPRFAGQFEKYMAGLITNWNEEQTEQIKRVETGLRGLELTGWVKSDRLDDVSVELKVGRLKTYIENSYVGDEVNIADVGFGVSQVLPVLVALAAGEKGQMVYIEQPELHLHPRAQVALAKVLADAANRGVRVIIETHSSLLLQGVMTQVAEGKLSNEKVILNWFERDVEGNTTVRKECLDENGAHSADWPVDFADIRLEEQKRYLNAVTKRRMGLVNEPA